MLETEACRSACGKIDDDPLRDLRDQLKRLRKGPQNDQWDRDSRAADSRLHMLIADNSGNPRLAQEIKRYLSLFRSVRNISHLRDSWEHYRRSNDVPQHLQIVEALIHRDPARAASAVDRHIRDHGCADGSRLLRSPRFRRRRNVRPQNKEPPMNDRFKGQIAVVTGGASGLGLGIATRLASEGAKVSLWDRNRDTLVAAQSQIEGSHSILVDIVDAKAVEAAAEQTVKELGRDSRPRRQRRNLRNNAPLWEYPLDEWNRIIQINLTGMFHCHRAIVPKMLAANYGRIVNIASIAGKEGNPNAAPYSASKAGVIALTKSLGKELADNQHPRKLHHPRRRPHTHLRPAHPSPHRLHAQQNPHETLRRSRRSRRHGRLDRQQRMLLHHRRRLRPLRQAAQHTKSLSE